MMRRACAVLLLRRKAEQGAQATKEGPSSEVGRSVSTAGRLYSPRCLALRRLDERWDLLTLRRSAAVKASSAAGPAAGSKAIPQEAARRKRGPVAGSRGFEVSAS
jgi:hypothetical protein